jgi:hypothetical protein
MILYYSIVSLIFCDWGKGNKNKFLFFLIIVGMKSKSPFAPSEIITLVEIRGMLIVSVLKFEGSIYFNNNLNNSLFDFKSMEEFIFPLQLCPRSENNVLPISYIIIRLCSRSV